MVKVVVGSVQGRLGMDSNVDILYMVIEEYMPVAGRHQDPQGVA
jgi:hypothetical protein